MSSERYRWMLVDDFVENINAYGQRTFVPGNHLEADETVIRWYGIGGGYVNKGLPMYLALERKPNNSGEIQNLADVASGIMLRLKVVKSANEEKVNSTDAAAANKDKDNCNNDATNEGGEGTQVLVELTEPWHDTGRVITADAYFASVEAALKMKDKGLHFIGNVKQCSKMFPMEVLSNTTLVLRGLRSVLASISKETGKMEHVAMSWLNRNRRYFIMTTCGIGEGEEINRKRLRQLNRDELADPDMVIIHVAQPRAIATYYEGAGTIDRHNRIHADKLRMDRNLGTKDWAKRFNLGVLGIICVDAYLLFKGVVHSSNRTTSCLKFFGKLADKLIENQEGVCVLRSTAREGDATATAAAAAATPTVRWTLCFKPSGKRHNQGRCGCTGCMKQTTLQRVHA
jgi:hypothetical protein